MPQITRQNVESLTSGQTLYHMRERGADKRPVRARVNGRPQTWKRNPAFFRLPMKHGLKNTFQIRNEEGKFWTTIEAECPANGKIATLQDHKLNRKHTGPLQDMKDDGLNQIEFGSDLSNSDKSVLISADDNPELYEFMLRLKDYIENETIFLNLVEL